jgi:hypothetical protein
MSLVLPFCIIYSHANRQCLLGQPCDIEQLPTPTQGEGEAMAPRPCWLQYALIFAQYYFAAAHAYDIIPLLANTPLFSAVDLHGPC